MVWVIGLLVIGVSCAIGAWFVIREAGRLAAEPPPPVFDMDEAFDWVVAHLPDIVAATLTPDDVRRILDFQLEFFQRQGVTGNGSSAHPPGDVIVGGAETVDYIVAPVGGDGRGVPPRAGARGGGDAARVPAGHRRGRRRGRPELVTSSSPFRRTPRAGPESATTDGPEKGGGPADAR